MAGRHPRPNHLTDTRFRAIFSSPNQVFSEGERVVPDTPLPEDRLVDLFDRLRKLAFNQHPLENSAVTMPQLTLLDWIAESPGCGIQDIAVGLSLTAPTVSVGVRRLERAGLLERQPNPRDGRAIQLSLTAQGQTLCQQAHAFRRDKMRRLLGGLSAQESATLLALLERAIDAAEAEITSTAATGKTR